MGTIEVRKTKKGKVRYRAIVRRRGYPHQYFTFSRKTDAQRWIRDTESDISNNRHFGSAEAKKHTVADMIDRYVSKVLPSKPTALKQGQFYQLERWKEELGVYLLSDIKPDKIAEVRDRLLEEKTCRGSIRKPATVKRYLAALSHAFATAEDEWGWITGNPVSRVRKPREPKGRVRFLSEDEMVRLLKVCRDSNNSFLHPIVVLAISVGPRQGNILNLKWQEVDIDRERIVLLDTKNNESQSVPLVGLAKDLLGQLFEDRSPGVDLVFPSKVDIAKPVAIRKAWEAAVEEAKLEDFRFHDLRHTAASLLAMNGASLLEIANILGHKTLEMVKRYAHLTENHTSLVVSRMNEKAFGE